MINEYFLRQFSEKAVILIGFSATTNIIVVANISHRVFLLFVIEVIFIIFVIDVIIGIA